MRVALPLTALVILSIFLSGCVSIIANKITEPQRHAMQGNTGSLFTELKICDNTSNCIQALEVAQPIDTPTIDLTFEYEINDNHNIWRYNANNTKSDASKPLSDDLIVIFAGYNQPAQILFVHQLWLHHITGATVLAVPAANHANRFTFGLDYVAPIIHEIHSRAPENVHLIGFSMGALAASKVANEIENSRLYLFAPMTNFEHSLQAIWDRQHSHMWYATFVSDNTLNNVVERIYEKAAKTPKETNLLGIIDDIDTDIFVYASTSDKVTAVAAWSQVKQPNINIQRYNKLNHIEMIALQRQQIMADLVSDLFGRKVGKGDTDILGVLCANNDKQCQTDFFKDDAGSDKK